MASILHYVCWYEGPGAVCKKKPWERLALLFSQVQVEYSERGTACRLTNLRLSVFSDPKNPWKRTADLDCKGGEAKHLLPALLPVLRRPCACFEKLVALWDQIWTVPTQEEYNESLSLGKSFLDEYAWLNQWSLEKGRNSFNIVATRHTFIHLLWGSRRLNPRLQWCFKSEDFVWHMSRVTHSISMGVASARLSQKLAPKYRVLLHFIISNEMFKLASKTLWNWEVQQDLGDE